MPIAGPAVGIAISVRARASGRRGATLALLRAMEGETLKRERDDENEGTDDGLEIFASIEWPRGSHSKR